MSNLYNARSLSFSFAGRGAGSHPSFKKVVSSGVGGETGPLLFHLLDDDPEAEPDPDPDEWEEKSSGEGRGGGLDEEK